MALLLALVGCEQIAGIEPRSFRRDGGLPDGAIEFAYPSQEQCDTYCGYLESGCTPETGGVFAYRKDSGYCNKLCLKIPLAADPAMTSTGNNFECRLRQAKDADGLKTDPGEGIANCLAAAAGGNGDCGSNCESYCQLFENICSETDSKPRENCLEECAALNDDPDTDADKSFSNDIDTVQCRLSHLGAAAAGDAPSTVATHCEHASLYVDAYTPCLSKKPRCQDYCALALNACTDKGETDLRQYETLQDCMNVCTNGLTLSPPEELGNKTDKENDNVVCRRYHAYTALLFGNADFHCNHVGPGGDGHCGRICPAYCKLVKTACPGATGYTKDFREDAECEAKCAELIDIPEPEKQKDIGYNISMGKDPKNPIQCRLYHATKAFARLAPPGECDSALGRAGSACPDPVP